MRCRHCNSAMDVTFVNLRSAPPSNAYLTEKILLEPQVSYPLRVMVCTRCWLVQTQDYTDSATLFDADYAYFSSYSSTWLQHCKSYVRQIIKRLALSEKSHVIEVAANDGYLLQFFKDKNIACTGIEPTAATAKAARKKGIEIMESFFSLDFARQLASQGIFADLMVANNVLAHVPDINDFISGFPVLLNEQGVATFEFPYLIELEKNRQFDTIYHEHFSYFSVTSLNRIFNYNGLSVFDVQALETHGGSLRVFAQRADTGSYDISSNVSYFLEAEKKTGVEDVEYYRGFQGHVDKICHDFISFLKQMRAQGKRVGGYSAAAKANTLINYAGVNTDFIPYIADKNPAKQGKYMPQSKIPIVSEAHILKDRPDIVIIFAWNIKDEIKEQLHYIHDWGGMFVTFIPELRIFS